MSAKVKLNLDGFRQVRRAAAPIITAQAEDIADRANAEAKSECRHAGHAGFMAVEAKETPEGSIALVSAGNDPCVMAHNAKHNTLVKAVG
nr:hypothetical protein [Bifidobacterium catenulatum]